MDCKLSLAAHFPKQHEAVSSRTRDRVAKSKRAQPRNRVSLIAVASQPIFGEETRFLIPTRYCRQKKARSRPSQKPGFSDIFCLPTEIWLRNPVSHPYAIRPQKKARLRNKISLISSPKKGNITVLLEH